MGRIELKLMKDRWAYVIFLALCLLAYGDNLNIGFHLDDHVWIIDPHGFKQVEGVLPFFTQDFFGFYRPVAFTFFKVLTLVFKDNPLGYHAVSLFLFWLVCVLFFKLIDSLFNNKALGFLAVCLYAVHPVNSILVNYTVASCFILTFLMMQVSFLLLLKFLQGKSKYWYFLSLLFYLMSLLSHEISFVLPLYLFLALYFVKDRTLGRSVKICLPYALIFMFYLWLRSQIPGVNPVDTVQRLVITFPEYIATVSQLIYWYVSKLFVPYGILIVWDTTIIQDNLLFWNVLFFGFVFIFLWMIFKWRKGVNAFALALLLAGLLPAGLASFVYADQHKTAFIQTHWFGFSCIGFFILVAHGFLGLRSKLNQNAWAGIGLAVVVALLLGTRQGNLVWKDEKTYCNYWLRMNPADQTAKVSKLRLYIIEHNKGLIRENYQDPNELLKLIECFKILGFKEKARQYELLLETK